MTVIVLTACTAGLRGHLTQWLLEISAGVFVGHVTTRIRDRLWARTTEMVGDGRAILVHQARGEQRLSFKVHGHHWKPVDFDGITLMLRPNQQTASRPSSSGWSNASKRRRFGRRTGRAQEADGSE